MLATVQHQQGRYLAQVLHRRLQRRAAGSAAHRFEHSAVDQAGVGQRSKLNQVDLRPTQVTGAEAQLQGQAGLTDTTDANQGDKSLSPPEQRPELVQLSFSSNEGGQGHRKVAGDLHVLRVVDTGARSGILRLPHANNYGTRGPWQDCSVSGAVSALEPSTTPPAAAGAGPAARPAG